MTQYSKPQLLFLLARCKESIIRLTIATSKLPQQIDPKECVMARLKESRTALEQHEEASNGANHQVPTTPLTITVDIFFITSDVQYVDSENNMSIMNMATFSVSDGSSSKAPAKFNAATNAKSCSMYIIVFKRGAKKAKINTI